MYFASKVLCCPKSMGHWNGDVPVGYSVFFVRSLVKEGTMDHLDFLFLKECNNVKKSMNSIICSSVEMSALVDSHTWYCV